MMPTSGGGFDQFTFTDLSESAISASTLSQFDTLVFLQFGDVADVLTASQKQAVNQWVSNGGKLIIYDSDACPAPSYSWLVYPFTTNNPGQLGSHQGVLTIVENNSLSSSDPNSPYYIDAAAITADTDAVGDSNVMVTRDARWIGDMQATNANGVTGWTHAYASFGSGLVIYNGLDSDDIEYSQGLQDIWLFELQQPWNPDGLPHSSSMAAGRADLIEEIESVRDTMLKSYDIGLGQVAFASTAAAQRRNNIWFHIAEWGSMLWKALKTSVSLVTKAISGLVSLKTFFSPETVAAQGSGEVKGVLNNYVKLMDQVEDNWEYHLLDASLFWKSCKGDFKDLQNYSLFIDGLDPLANKSDAAWKLWGGEKNWNKIEADIKYNLDYADSLKVALRSGAQPVAGRVPSTTWATTPMLARLKTRRIFNDLIAAIPDPLPPGFPTGEVIAELERVRLGVVDSFTKSSIVRYPSVPPGATTVEPRTASLGEIAQLRAVTSMIIDAQTKKLKIREQQVWSDGLDLELNAVRLYALDNGAGTTLKVLDGVDLGKAFIDEAFPIDDIETANVRGMAPDHALMLNEKELILAIPSHVSNLWSISACLDQYLRFKLAQ